MIGILALQGCVEPHEAHLEKLGIPHKRVRLPKDLQGIGGLILPGGESTTMLHLLRVFDMVEAVQKRAKEIPYWGICAGSILMARELVGKSRGPNQISLNIMDIIVERNAYGRQMESFTDGVELGDGSREEATFIRAPKFSAWGKNVRVAGNYGKEAVFLEEGQHMVTAFHPELSQNLFFHRYFAKKCGLAGS